MERSDHPTAGRTVAETSGSKTTSNAVHEVHDAIEITRRVTVRDLSVTFFGCCGGGAGEPGPPGLFPQECVSAHLNTMHGESRGEFQLVFERRFRPIDAPELVFSCGCGCGGGGGGAGD